MMVHEKSLPVSSPKIHFPQDEGLHPDSLIEWWYGNFSLTDSKGNEYEAMTAYFAPGLKILSISDPKEQHYHQEISFSTRDFAQGILDLRWGDNDHWYRTDPNTLTYRLESHGTDIGLNLGIVSNKPPLPVGGDGLVEWTEGKSYYYSLTRLQVEGQIKVSGKKIDVKGIGWMDHQWMNAMGMPGWDWFCAQLDDDTDIIFWQIVGPDKSIKSRDITIMSADLVVYHSNDIALEKLDSWVSLQSGNEYGILWRVQEKTRGLDMEIRARYPQQEIRMFDVLPAANFAFWEGSTNISGHLDGKEVSGKGYAELLRAPLNAEETLAALLASGSSL
jgi:predicted secreted hydrolase